MWADTLQANQTLMNTLCLSCKTLPCCCKWEAIPQDLKIWSQLSSASVKASCASIAPSHSLTKYHNSTKSLLTLRYLKYFWKYWTNSVFLTRVLDNQSSTVKADNLLIKCLATNNQWQLLLSKTSLRYLPYVVVSPQSSLSSSSISTS